MAKGSVVFWNGFWDIKKSIGGKLIKSKQSLVSLIICTDVNFFLALTKAPWPTVGGGACGNCLYHLCNFSGNLKLLQMKSHLYKIRDGTVPFFRNGI